MVDRNRTHFLKEIKKRGVKVKDSGKIHGRTSHLWLAEDNVGWINPEIGDAFVGYRFPASAGDHAPASSHDEAVQAFERLFPGTRNLITTRGNKPKEKKYYVVILDEHLAIFACLRLKLWKA